MEQLFDPTRPRFEKLHVEPAPAPGGDEAELEVRIAEKVRADSKDRHALTPEAAVIELAPDLPRERLSAILSRMGSDGRYGDIKAVVAPSGRIYLYSEAHLIAVEALDKGRIEECMAAIAGKIRADSADRAELTPVTELDALMPSAGPEARAALLKEMQADPRYADLQLVTGAKGERWFHSDAHLSGNYARILVRAKAADPCLAIAELVRDRSRIFPAPTSCAVFRERVFGIAPEELDGAVAETLARPEYGDICKLVHPATGAVYLYSSQHLEASRAYFMMDWEEVGRHENP